MRRRRRQRLRPEAQPLIGSGQAPLIIPKTYPARRPPSSPRAPSSVSDYIDLMPLQGQRSRSGTSRGDPTRSGRRTAEYYLAGLHQDVWVDYSLAVRPTCSAAQPQGPGHLGRAADVLQAMKAAYPRTSPSRPVGVPTPGAACSTRSRRDTDAGGWGYFNATGQQCEEVRLHRRPGPVQADAPVLHGLVTTKAARSGELHAVRRQRDPEVGRAGPRDQHQRQTLIND